MDPFTEKLLERTRARRENLQKKMADRPTSANRLMVKRAREPLAESNSVITEPPIERVPPSSKPSPSKRRCSDENTLHSGGENKEPTALHPDPVAPEPQPHTDKKPPMVPANLRPMEKRSSRPTLEPERSPEHAPAEPEQMEDCPRKVDEGRYEPKPPADSLGPLRETAATAPPTAAAPASTGMRSRLQRLAEQRQYWDSDGSSDAVVYSAPSPIKSQRAEPTIAPSHSEAAVGRKGRLANLAATICSWEDDIGHQSSHQDNGVPPPSRKAAARDPLPAQPAASKMHASHSQQIVNSPVKSGRVIPPSPQKTQVPEPKLVRSSPVSSPLKSQPTVQHSTHSAARGLPPSPQRNPVPQSPLKSQAHAREPETGKAFGSSPQKPTLLLKSSSSSSSVTAAQGHERPLKEVTPLQQRSAAGTPGVKSFLERFGERCQERSSQSTPCRTAASTATPTLTPSATPTCRLLQERLRTAEAPTATASLAQKQKLEREAELAMVRSRFQKGNMWKDKDTVVADFKNNDPEPRKEEIHQPAKNQSSISHEDETPSTAVFQPQDPPTSFSTSETDTSDPVAAPVMSPLKTVESPVRKPFVDEKQKDTQEEEDEEVRQVEMNVDGSINSEVINELFEGVLEESQEYDAREEVEEEEEEEEEEEDGLNISSMSLLTPLAETVAAVVQSPEKKLMTSTPASSFSERGGAPDGVSRPSRFQRARVLRAGSADGIDNADEEKNLPYSIDAYRSTRVKEVDRPDVKQVIVRKEEVTHRMQEARSPSSISIKHRMKLLTNEMNMQQTVIHQASQALNCCTDEEHGKGSPVEAEAERLLLIATEKRVALKAELDRLKAEGPAAQRGTSIPADVAVSASRGSISLLELRLPLKADFVCSSANKPECGSHFFFVMLRAGAENTVATPLASTRSALSGDALTFPTTFTLSDVSNDFGIDIEVYCLVQKRELNPEKRKKPSKSKAITPKRFLAITKSNLQTPVMASPGGPNAVRTSNFALVGSHKLTLASIGKNKFPLEKIKYEGTERDLLSDMFLNKVPFLCPLEGHIYLKLRCEVGSRLEEKGFLTMFEDVSGFGAWHRRWCVLSGYCISYWTYPNDEKCKSPIGRINLANCTSRKVEPANREFCARPNTFELITVRPQKEDDRETLVSQCMNTMCVTKNWLSADTKEERNLWMLKLNQILVDLRMWQPDACYRPQ